MCSQIPHPSPRQTDFTTVVTMEKVLFLKKKKRKKKVSERLIFDQKAPPQIQTRQQACIKRI